MAGVAHLQAFIHRTVRAQTLLISPELEQSSLKDVSDPRLSCFLFTELFAANGRKCGLHVWGLSACLC